MRLRHYPIPKEITSEIKFTRYLFLIDVLILGGAISFAMWFDKYVHIAFVPFFVFFMVVIGLVAIIRPKSNPKKRMYEVFWLTLLKEKTVYISMKHTQKEVKR